MKCRAGCECRRAADFAEYIPTARAGDSIRFLAYAGRGLDGRAEYRERSAAVLPLLVFPDHVQVKFTPCGYTVDASNFIRLNRRASVRTPGGR